MLISPTPATPKVALEAQGVRQMAYQIACHFPITCERRQNETLDEYLARAVASMRLAATLVQVNPAAAEVIMQTLTPR